EPDIVFAGWESNFTSETAGEREELAELGITTYVAPPACQEPQYQPNPLTFDDIFDYLTQTGELLGAPEAAAELVAAQRITSAAASVPRSSSWTPRAYATSTTRSRTRGPRSLGR